MDGFLIIDKPAGITSHDVVNQVRRIFNTRQVGHAGTLDPMATGVMIVAVGWATRLLELVVTDTKGYAAEVLLGRETNTDDITGQVTKEFTGELPALSAIETALEKFRGTIQQRPPNFSAIKQQGQPVYKKARTGEALDLPLRTVTISKLEVKSYAPPLLSLRVECGSGTYIRSVARDLGQELGCGGTLNMLHRFRSGSWEDSRSVQLESLKTTDLLPCEILIETLPSLEVSAEGYTRLLQGSPLPGEHEELEALPVVTYLGKIVAMLRWKESHWWPRKVRPASSLALEIAVE